MEDFNGNGDREEVYSKSVKAGKRTYFFDVKSTKGKDLYITITESKKKYVGEDKFVYEKHKIFLYKEDFDKFYEGLRDVLDKVNDLKASGEYPDTPSTREDNSDSGNRYSDLDFDDLNN
jgi:hypothetical protein